MSKGRFLVCVAESTAAKDAHHGYPQEYQARKRHFYLWAQNLEAFETGDQKSGLTVEDIRTLAALLDIFLVCRRSMTLDSRSRTARLTVASLAEAVRNSSHRNRLSTNNEFLDAAC
jgi:hypothetical protein